MISRKNLNSEHINENWVFSNVVSDENTNFIISHADNVGYKRTSRERKPAPNDLFEYVLKNNQTTIDLKNKDKIINYLREKIEW